jgi:hypothetical protein
MRNPDCEKYDDCLTGAAHKNKNLNCLDCKGMSNFLIFDKKKKALTALNPQEEKPMEEIKDMENTSISKPLIKRCSKCGENKPLDEFGTSKIAKDGKNWYCKKCNAERAKESWRKHHGGKDQFSDARLREIADKVEKRAEFKPPELEIISKLELLKKDLLRKVSAIDTAIEALR